MEQMKKQDQTQPQEQSNTQRGCLTNQSQQPLFLWDTSADTP